MGQGPLIRAHSTQNLYNVNVKESQIMGQNEGEKNCLANIKVPKKKKNFFLTKIIFLNQI